MPSQWKTEKLYFHGDEYYDSLLKGIREAKQSILIETYIFHDDLVGWRVIFALIDALKRDVQVRLHVDGAGSFDFSPLMREQFLAAGGEFKVYHPAPWQTPLSLFGLWSFLREVGLRFQRANKRNHRKICIIDETRAWVGSFNISQVHLSVDSGGESWRDTAIEVMGEQVWEMVEAFEVTWETSRIEKLKQAWRKRSYYFNLRSLLVQLNYRFLMRRFYYKDRLLRMRSAGRTIWIQSAYFLPNTVLLRTLAQASRRGVDVRLILPGKSDIIFFHWLMPCFFEVLLQAGVKIFRYRPSVLHAKVMMVDDFSLVGSSNLNYRSMLHDLEADVVVTHEENIQKLKDQFEADQAESKLVTMDDLGERTILQKILGRFFLMLKYWL